MKNSTWLIILSGVAALWWSVHAAEQSPAGPVKEPIRVAQQQQGCCKAWDPYGRDWQVLYGYDYDTCTVENSRRDGDDVNQQSGEIWWDTYC